MSVTPGVVPVGTTLNTLTLAAGTVGGLAVANSIDPVNDYIPIYTNSATATQGINRNTYLNLLSQPLGQTDTQTISNKTLNNTNNATILDGSLTLENTASNTKKAQFSLSGITAGNTRIISLPDYNGTVATLAGTETLSAKTLSSPTINSPTITNATISADSITGYTTSNAGSIYGMAVSAATLNASYLVASSITSTKIATNGVSAENLAINAIYLGKISDVTSSQTFTSGAGDVAVTGFSLTVTIPAGGRSIEVIAVLPTIGSLSAAGYIIKLWRETVGGTLLQSFTGKMEDSADDAAITIPFIHTPSAGSITYLMSVSATTANVVATMSSSQPGQMWVKAI